MIEAGIATFLMAFASAFIPAVPVEPYLIGAATVTGQSALLLGVTAGAGQTTGKALMLLGLRGTLRSTRLRRWLERHTARFAPEPKPAVETVAVAPSGTAPSGVAPSGTASRGTGLGAAAPAAVPPRATVRTILRRSVAAVVAVTRRWNNRLITLLNRPFVAVPVVLLSAAVGLPPLLLVVFCISSTRMSVGMFAVTCFVGRTIRFAAVSVLPELAHLLG
ncbi:hypothetical protein [Salinispora sp. H7-4]|uniref:hypothetical protein n=1 Tax=Salinispora sp. H7-4 TaxID=2748321 RepID=UPI0015D25E4B|nr:hypothetical protein [Salinispora sp. H7-4]NYT96128.1 hypothetical protein [Salinispora sp. H7-4]